MPIDGALDELAAFLTTPAKSGIYLTRNELLALARVSDASLRISERRRMLADLFKSAQSAEDLLAFLDRLLRVCRTASEDYQRLSADYPHASQALGEWADRASATARRLEQIRAEVALAR